MLNSLIRGGQIVLHSWQMLKQVLKALFFSSLFIILTIVAIRINFQLNKNDIKFTSVFYVAKFYTTTNRPNRLLKVNLYNNKNLSKQIYTAKQLTENSLLINAKHRAKIVFVSNFYFGIKLYIYSIIIVLVSFLIKGYTTTKSNFIRGNKIISPKLLNKLIRHKNGLFYTLFGKKYKIANILTYPKGTESLHTIITGTTGTGKTVLLTNLIEQIRKNGDRAIIYDKMGTFTSRFYNKNKDIILNPLDDRSPYWSIFNEAKNTIDFETIATALIPDTGSDPFFTQAARILFSSVASELFKRGSTSNKDLTDKLLKTELKDSAELVKGTPAQAIIDENNPKTALSVMAVLSANLKSLLHLRETPNETGEIFSIREWIQNDKQDGFLFLTSRADQHETLKPLISTWTDIAINTLLSLEQSNNRNIWIIIDELPSLNYLPSLHSGLAESRQFGGRFVLALQLPAQLKSIYGDRKAEATSGLCGTRIILRTPDEDTATWCSNNLGKTEIEEVKQSISFGASELRDGVSLNKNIITKSIVSPTEIMNLDNLNAYVKLAGDFPITKLTFNYKNYPKIAEKFVERKISALGNSNCSFNINNTNNNIKTMNDNQYNNTLINENKTAIKYNKSKKQNRIKDNIKELADTEEQMPKVIKASSLENNDILSPELKAIRDDLIKQGKIIIENDKVDNNIVVDDKIDNISISDEGFEDL